MRVPYVSRVTETRDRRSGSRRRNDAGSATADGVVDRLARGSKAGFVATLVMTAYRLPVSRSLPPTARFWAEYVAGGDPADHPVAALALHLLYGTAAGAVFGAATPAGSGPRPAEPRSDVDERTGPRADGRANAADGEATASRELRGLLWGVCYALALSAFGERVLLARLLGMDLAADERLVFHAGHAVYGLGLGTLYGSRSSHDEP